MSSLPACCIPSENATPAERAYCAYNAAGDPATAGLNYAGKPCPTWAELPENVREKWEAAADEAVRAYFAANTPPSRNIGDVVRLRSGGPNLTVNVAYSLSSMCAWFGDDGTLHTAEISNAALKVEQGL